MHAITFVYQALARRRFLYFETKLRELVISISSKWLVRDSNVDDQHVQDLWDLIQEYPRSDCPDSRYNWLSFSCEYMEIDWQEAPINGASRCVRIPRQFIEETGLPNQAYYVRFLLFQFGDFESIGPDKEGVAES